MKILENLKELREEIKSKSASRYTQRQLKEIKEKENSLIKKSISERKYISGGKTLTTSQIYRLVAKKTGYQLKDTREVIDSYIEVLLEEIYNRRSVEISGIGTFYSTYRTIRPTRDPVDKKQTWLSQPVSQVSFYLKRTLSMAMRENILSEEEIFANYYPENYIKENRNRRKPKEIELTDEILKARQRNEELFGDKI